MEERNKPYYAVSKEEADKNGFLIQKGQNISTIPYNLNEDTEYHPAFCIENTSEEYLLIPASQKRVLYDGRYTAVAAFIYAIVNGKFSVLANQRGSGTPDFQGCWNCPCGFLERNEHGVSGAARETLEETGLSISPSKLRFVGVQTNPSRCNNGNVTLRYTAFLGHQPQITSQSLNDNGGEENEVANVRWIPLSEVDNYEWAFFHADTIFCYAPKRWKRRLLELCYKLFV